MNNFKYVLGMLAVGGLAGVAAPASAATTVALNLNMPTDASAFEGGSITYDITLEGGQLGLPQFSYVGSPDAFLGGGPFGPVFGVKHTFNALGTARIAPLPLSSFSLPTSATVIDQTNVTTYKENDIVSLDASDTYYHLSFNNDAGDTFLGAAKFTGTTLDSITYQQADGVPEADVWALMILGLGATGAVLRRRREAQLAA